MVMQRSRERPPFGNIFGRLLEVISSFPKPKHHAGEASVMLCFRKGEGSITNKKQILLTEALHHPACDPATRKTEAPCQEMHFTALTRG